ncbi:MAG: tRNA (adenosine(37)-N6)-dimethylallyltransferase MiaA [Candidatus Nanopelagicales bacterium]|nr:tRNA (adenosine(37)-N6)-dimethylallyltransferase MiaA [Candidatus Nanopelagicales bacterium]
MKVIALVGPTAVGKTALSLDLALELSAEIINADAMQIYKGMDIGTAKLPLSQRRGVIHHQIDVLDPIDEANVSQYQKQTREIIRELLDRKVQPILVGGSGLYVNSVLEDLEFPGTSLELRAKYEELLEEKGVEHLFKMLEEIDPLAAENILPNNARKIVRALEVNELTGKRFNAKLPEPSPIFPDVRIALDMPRDLLDKRITERVHQMFADGFIDEVQKIEESLRKGKTSLRALGYSQVLSYLAGEIQKEEAITLTINATKKFARRQLSWFRRDPLIHWLDATSSDLFEQSMKLIR